MSADQKQESTTLVELNVGGVKFCTMIETLLRDPQSLLGRYFSSVASRRDTATPSSDQHHPAIRRLTSDIGDAAQLNGTVGSSRKERFFIDRSGELFAHILEYLRNDKEVILPDRFKDLKR